jgi:hypothetical protein
MATLTTGSTGQGSTLGPDGLVWFLEQGTNNLAKLGYVTAASPGIDPSGPGGSGGSRDASGGSDLGSTTAHLPSHPGGGPTGGSPGGSLSGTGPAGGVNFGPVQISPQTGDFTLPVGFSPCGASGHT